jgi:DNA-binding MarR family transcriptional regulator
VTPSTPTRSPAEEAASAVLETVPLVMRAIRARMREGRPVGVTVAQFRTLLFIRRRPGTDLSGVAEHLGTSLPAASELVARLVRQELVARETDPASRRRIRLTLSISGNAQLEAAERRTTEWFVKVLGRRDPAHLGVLVDGLQELRTLMAQEDEASPAAASSAQGSGVRRAAGTLGATDDGGGLR